MRSITRRAVSTRALSALAACAAFALALPAAAASPPVRVDQAWVRATPPGAMAGAAYMALTNTGKAPDRLLGGSAPGVQRVEVHEMSMAGGIMRMRPVSGGLVLAPGATVALKPGGYHIMLIGLSAPLRAGEVLPLTLRFEKAGEVALKAPIRTPPAPGAH